MLESFNVNICVETAGHDFYDMVAINKYPIVVLGRKSDLRTQLSSSSIKDYIKKNIRTLQIYESSKFYIVHLKRNNTIERMEIPVPELVQIDETEFESK